MTISAPEIWHIEHRKIVSYLLDLSHQDGHAKARAFLCFGFQPSEPDKLAHALFDHVANVPYRVVETRADVRFVFEGPIATPRGTMPNLRSVWVMIKGNSVGRLVTAYPFDEK